MAVNARDQTRLTRMSSELDKESPRAGQPGTEDLLTCCLSGLLLLIIKWSFIDNNNSNNEMAEKYKLSI